MSFDNLSSLMRTSESFSDLKTSKAILSLAAAAAATSSSTADENKPFGLGKHRIPLLGGGGHHPNQGGFVFGNM